MPNGSKSFVIARIARCCLLGLLLLVAGTAVHAQSTTVDTAKPIVVKNPKPAKLKPGKFVGQVLSSTPKSITVRSQNNLMAVRTFAYAENLSASGFSYGQNVEIDYTPGSDTALRIRTLSAKSRTN